MRREVGTRAVTADWSATINGVEDWPVVVFATVTRHGETFYEPGGFVVEQWRAEAVKVRADENGDPVEVRDSTGAKVYEDVTEQITGKSRDRLEEHLCELWWEAV